MKFYYNKELLQLRRMGEYFSVAWQHNSHEHSITRARQHNSHEHSRRPDASTANASTTDASRTEQTRKHQTHLHPRRDRKQNRRTHVSDASTI